ncbi:MAG: signal peptidase II [Planctomycetota bacterium]|jgi:signal peptidase II
MTEFKKEESARPSSGRPFLSDTKKPLLSTPFLRGFVMPPLKAQLVFWPLMVLGLTLDLWSKRAVFDWLLQKQSSRISIIDGFLQFVVMENKGAAFGIASGQRYLLIMVSVIALIVIFGIFLFSGTERRLVHIALGLFAAGVCGNLYDRVFNNGGAVRDFIDVVYWPGKHWPAFNVADSLLCVGVGLMIISCILTDKSPQEHAQQHK